MLLAFRNGRMLTESGIETGRNLLVRDGRIAMVDELTGRIVADRHWPDGLQAALEAKDRATCGAVAPPEGLYLAKVDYSTGT